MGSDKKCVFQLNLKNKKKHLNNGSSSVIDSLHRQFVKYYGKAFKDNYIRRWVFVFLPLVHKTQKNNIFWGQIRFWNRARRVQRKLNYVLEYASKQNQYEFRLTIYSYASTGFNADTPPLDTKRIVVSTLAKMLGDEYISYYKNISGRDGKAVSDNEKQDFLINLSVSHVGLNILKKAKIQFDL